MKHFHIFCVLILLTFGQTAAAQNVKVSTVSRAPFSMFEGGADIGFSIDLVNALLAQAGRSATIIRVDEFSQMLSMVETGAADLAIANISITASREAVMDFSHPIFESGLQIMVPTAATSTPSIFWAMLSPELLGWLGMAFALLLGLGMVMWLFERRRQPYFDRDLAGAWFPSFWWALNLVVNGGFEERVPRSPIGRLLAVCMVLSSLFVVSVFVATITATMTVEAISGRINTITDLYGTRVGTIHNSTANTFLKDRKIRTLLFDDLEQMLIAFEDDELDAVVFDAPILAYYANTRGRGTATLVGSMFHRENYGIAFTSGSPLVEEVNQALLRMREDGSYEALRTRWFGANY